MVVYRKGETLQNAGVDLSHGNSIADRKQREELLFNGLISYAVCSRINGNRTMDSDKTKMASMGNGDVHPFFGLGYFAGGNANLGAG